MQVKSDNVFISFLELLGVKYTWDFSNRYFNEHPHKYNLFGISKMLSNYGIDNAGVRVTDKEKDIFEIETPFIAHTGSDFATVYKVEPGYKENRKKELLKIAQISIFLIATCLILVLGYISNSLFKNPGLTFLTVLNLLGVYIGYLLVLK